MIHDGAACAPALGDGRGDSDGGDDVPRSLSYETTPV